MPFPVHPITPTSLSRSVVTDSSGEEFTCVANNTLAQAMRQMVSLLKHADDIFCDLENQCETINNNTKKIIDRVTNIEGIVNKMDSKTEKIPGDLASFSKIKTHFKRDYPIDEHLFTRDNRPKAIQTLYDEAGLSRIPQEDENTDVSYLCIPIPAHTYPGKQQYFDVDAETKKVLNEYNLTVRGRKRVQTSGSYIHIKGPENKRPSLSASSSSVPSEVVSVDVSGKNFSKMKETTMSYQSVSRRRKGKKKKERPTTSLSGENAFGREGMSLEEINGRSCYSEGPTGSDSLSFDSSILSHNEQINLFYSGEPDISDIDSDRSATVTPIPDMEFVTTVIESKPKRKHKKTNHNPFLNDVSNPFEDDKIEDEIESLGKEHCDSIDTHSSSSTVFEQNNPFFIPRENTLESNFIDGKDKLEFDHAANKNSSNIDNTYESKTDDLYLLDSFDGLDEVVKELELLALVEQELNEEEMKEKDFSRKQKPSPPKRHSSLFHNCEDKSIIKDISNKSISFSDVEDSVPLCLSVETKRKELDIDSLAECAANYESNDEDNETSDRKEHETDKDNDSKKLLAPTVNINNTEDIMLKAPDVVITNREDLSEDPKQNEKLENKTLPGLPDMLTHVSDNNGLKENKSLDTSDLMAAPETQARSAEQRLSESVTESATHPGMTNNVQYKQEAPRLRITEPFTRETWIEEPIEERRFCEGKISDQEKNQWELPDIDLSQEIMEQQWMVRNHPHANMSNRQKDLKEYKDITEEKKSKKKGFFRTLKNTFGFSSKSKKPTKDENNKIEYKDFDNSLANQFLPDSPRMTSTPLTRSASARDSRGVSCSIDRHGQESLMRLPDCTKFGGDLPPAYRTAALKNQHQRWSFAAISQTMYQPNPNTVQEQLLPYNTAMQADLYYTLPTQLQYPPPYHPSYSSYPLTTAEPTPISRPRSYSNQPYPTYGINRVEEDRRSLALYPPFLPTTSSIGGGAYIPAPSPSSYYDYTAEPGMPGCDCPMCYHSVNNTCSVCGCPNSTGLGNNNQHSTSLQYSTSNSTQHSTSTSTQPSTTTGHNNTARHASPYRAVLTSPSIGKPQVLPSRSIHQLYSQRKSSSPADVNTADTYAGTERTNLYKPTSLQDFKKLISMQPDQNDIEAAKRTESEGVSSMVKTSGSLKKPSLWMDNRFSIIQEEPDMHIQDRRSQEEDLAKMGFLV